MCHDSRRTKAIGFPEQAHEEEKDEEDEAGPGRVEEDLGLVQKGEGCVLCMVQCGGKGQTNAPFFRFNSNVYV